MEMASGLGALGFVLAIPIGYGMYLSIVGSLSDGTASLLTLVELYWILNTRGICHASVVFAFTYGAIVTHTASIAVRFAKVPLVVGFAAAAFTPYLRDGRLLILLSHLAHAGIQTGGQMGAAEVRVGSIVLTCAFGAFGVYLYCLVERRSRLLPPALHGCRFVRLGSSHYE